MDPVNYFSGLTHKPKEVNYFTMSVPRKFETDIGYTKVPTYKKQIDHYPRDDFLSQVQNAPPNLLHGVLACKADLNINPTISKTPIDKYAFYQAPTGYARNMKRGLQSQPEKSMNGRLPTTPSFYNELIRVPQK